MRAAVVVRDTCSSEKQELQGEVTALQRELERCYLAEKTVRRAQFSARAILTADRAISTPRAILTAAPFASSPRFRCARSSSR